MNTNYVQVEAKMYHHKEWIQETNPIKLKASYGEKLQQAGFDILKFDEHFFPEQGYTCFWLLCESHLAIHTFPESEKSYVELTSCNQEKLKHFLSL